PKTIHYGHTTGTVLGIRHLWDGAAAQTYLLIEGAPAYNAGVTFHESTSVDDSLMEVITTRLLPAMDGYRPKLRQSGVPHPPKNTESDEAPAAGEEQRAEAEAEVQEPAPATADQTGPTTVCEDEVQAPAEEAPAPKARPRTRKTATTTAPTAAKKTSPRRPATRKTKTSPTA
ncbi:hypothetical protein ACFW6V_35790, partial [Streptomyces sp. NPDC058734]